MRSVHGIAATREGGHGTVWCMPCGMPGEEVQENNLVWIGPCSHHCTTPAHSTLTDTDT